MNVGPVQQTALGSEGSDVDENNYFEWAALWELIRNLSCGHGLVLRAEWVLNKNLVA